MFFMKDFFVSLIVFVSSSVIILVFAKYASTLQSIVQFVAFLLVMILVIITLFYHILGHTKIKWCMLFLTTLAVQLLVIATGGLSSPFFILLHLTALGVGLLINSNTSLLFLASSALVLVGSVIFDHSAQSLWLQDPAATILFDCCVLPFLTSV
jgi:hypothetical protein